MRALNEIHHVGVAAAVAGVLFTVGVTSAVLAQNANGAPDCRDEQGLAYVCDLVVPEEVLSVGSTGLILAGGHRAPGHMYLIDPAAGTTTELIQTSAFRQQHDTAAYPYCPGPLNTQSFDVHGMSMLETSPRLFNIYSTSHGEREAIEIYDLDLRGAAPVLTWKGCVVLQQDGYFNGVARLADGGFVTTRMRDASARNADLAPGQITGRVFEWHPGGQLQPLAGTELSRANGIEVSQDQRYVYVTATGTRELVRFDLRAPLTSKRAVSLPMNPDNVHWDSNGSLLIAGRNPPDPAACPDGGCPTGWTVVEVDPETFTVTRLGGADGSVALQRASAAIRVGNDIWVASNDDRIARFSLSQP